MRRTKISPRGYEDSDFEDYPKATKRDNVIFIIESTVILLVTLGIACGFAVLLCIAANSIAEYYYNL